GYRAGDYRFLFIHAGVLSAAGGGRFYHRRHRPDVAVDVPVRTQPPAADFTGCCDWRGADAQLHGLERAQCGHSLWRVLYSDVTRGHRLFRRATVADGTAPAVCDVQSGEEG